MMPVRFSIPFLPPSLNVYRNDRWPKQRAQEKTWKDYIAVEWAKLGRPRAQAIRIAMLFSFPDRRTRDMDNYLATGSKLVGDAVKGLFIPDDSPKYLKAWSFHFEFSDKAKTTVTIEEAGKTAPNGFSMLQESSGGQAGMSVAGAEAGAERNATGAATLWGKADADNLATEPAALRGKAGSDQAADRLSTGSAALWEKAGGDQAADRPVCNFSETCFAPLCPLDQISLGGVWYPDEEICRSKVHGNLSWIKAQRKIVKANAQANRYFTLAMLERNCIVRPGIAGLDPDENEEAQLKKWFAEHPPKKEMSGEERMAKVSHLKTPPSEGGQNHPHKRS